LFGFWNKILFLGDRGFRGCKLLGYFLSAPKGNSYEDADSYASARILQRFPSIWMGLLRTPGSSTGGAEATYAKCACTSGAATSRTTEASLHRFCGATGLDPFADLATWADDERDVRRETGPWHFIDIPLGAARTDVSGACDASTGCVTTAIQQQLDILRNATGTLQDQANALMFVVHFVGDIHQPLHATTNNDRGGNCIPVKFFNRKPRLTNASTGSYKPNLHGVWDTEIVERVGKIGGSHDTDVQAFADHLAVEFASDIPTWQSTPPDFEAWAWESHELAVNISYGKLPRSVSVETPKSVDNCTDDNNVSARMKTLHESVGQHYVTVADPVISEQLARAGTRLAMLLNRLWP